jgi:ABC-2 type transport system ATP-binding protein
VSVAKAASEPPPAPADSATARLEGVSRWFGTTVAVADVSAELHPGVTGLLGHNGAGKTTALKLLAGYDSPSAGQVRVFGVDPRRFPKVYERIGIAPEGALGWAFLSVTETVSVLAGMRGVADPDGAAAEAIALVGLEDARGRRVGDLSHGMRQRVKIAQALAHSPEFLLLDEPLNGLDPGQREGIIELVERLGHQGLTVVVSSHVLPEVERMAGRVLVLVNGRLVAEGAPAAIRRLMADVPRSVRVVVDAGARALASELVRADSIVSVEATGSDQIVLETRDGDALARALPGAARAAGVVLRQVEPVGDDLESVYAHLHERARGARR